MTSFISLEERGIEALERIANSLDQRDRIEALEELLNDFVVLMKTPHASDEDWVKLLEDVEEALT